MARVKQNPYPDIPDYFGQYQNWKPITLPSGEVVYELPGHPERVFVPSLSHASGNVVLRPNPKNEIEAQKEAEAIAKKQQEQGLFNSSMAGQLLPVGALTAGTIAANQFGGKAVDPITQAIADRMKAGESLADIGKTATTPAQAAAAGAIEQTSPVTSTIPYTPTPVGSAQGGTLMSDGSIQTDALPPGTEVTDDGSIINSETGQTVGRVAQGAFGAYQIYQGINEFGDDKIGGTLGIASGAANVGQALGYESASGFAAPLMAAKGGYDMYKAFQHGGEGVRGAGATLGAGIGTMILPGLGTLAGGAIGNAAGYALDKFAPGAFHKTTKQREADRWADTGVSDEVAASMVGHDYFAGTGGEESRDESLLTPDAIRLNPDNYHNIPDWDQWSKEKQDRFLSTMLREGKVQERKGGIYYDDARAKELADQIRAEGMNIQNKQPAPGNPQAAAAAAAQGAMSRTATRSPGIRLDGSRIIY